MIINADDLGFDESRDVAIIRAFAEDLVSSATMMATRPALGHAADLVRESGLGHCVGVHLVLTEDEPLTDKIRTCPVLCDAEGRFRERIGPGDTLRLGSDGRRLVFDELCAQVQRVRAEGLALTHFDSHHHTHTDPVLIGIVLAVARAYAVPAIRLASACDPRSGPQRRAAVVYANGRIRRSGRARTRWFGRVEDIERMQKRGARNADDCEVMVHPALAADDSLIDTGGEPLASFVARVRRGQPIVSYAGTPATRTTER